MQQKISLITPVRYLKGVGPERQNMLERLGLASVEDLFYFFPRRYEDRSLIKPIAALGGFEKECVEGEVQARGVVKTKTGQTLFRAVVGDKTGVVLATYFNQPYLSKVFTPKTRVFLYGKAEREGSRFRMIHPEFEILASQASSRPVHTHRIVPVYPLTEDLSQKGMRSLLFHLIDYHLPLVHEFLPMDLRRRLDLLDAWHAMRGIHFPDSFAERDRAYRRLAFDEFFLMQIAVQMKKARLKTREERILHAGDGELVQKYIHSLDFSLTAGQSAAIEDILAEMKKPEPMNRLIQGDVGSGKTVVAGAALLFTVSNGFQGALMAPTEVLAQQHYFSLLQLLEPFGVRLGYLAQNQSASEKENILAGAASGEIQIIVGTHALIQEKVNFKKLGLCVIDEQHKFGVFQRGALKQKSKEWTPHLLLLTATPIPRTLAMTLYGDMDLSTIAELPKGRKPVKTFWVGQERRKEIYNFIESLLKEKKQGYVICPVIELEKDGRAKSVFEAHAELSRAFPERRIGILHGKMKSAEKQRIMREFKEGKIEVLVSTVVVEVGVDVPNAVFMIIENAEKFGLAQLHQLRGRVGRASEESFCVLFSSSQSEETVERLEAFSATTSGFEISEKDLAIRGGGDLLGVRQHGLPALRIGDFSRDVDLLLAARDEARRIIEADPTLQSPVHVPIRKALLRRFRLPKERTAVLA